MLRKTKFLTIFLGSFFTASLLLINFAQALDFTPPEIRDSSYQAQYQSQTIVDPITMEAGSNKEVIIKFKNTGSKIWNSSGYNYVSVYTINAKYRSSQFANSTWLTNSQATKLSKTTKPGQIGEFKIKLTAPTKIGEYKEDFYLAAENTTWIKGGYFYLKIKVTAATTSLTNSTAGQANFTFSKYLYLDDKNEEVKQLQTVLKNLGYYTYSQITGYYGPITKQAVVAFQKSQGLSPYPGWLGPATRQALNKYLAEQSAKKTISQTDVKISSPPNTVKNDNYQADVVVIKTDKFKAAGGKQIKFFIVFNNSGKKSWNNYSWSESDSLSNGKLVSQLDVADQSWQSAKKVVTTNKVVEPGQNLRLVFYLRTPAKKGNYTVKFKLVADGQQVDGAVLSLPIEVTADAPASYQAPVWSSQPTANTRELITEPKVRIGLYSTNKAVKFISPYPYTIYADKDYKGLLAPNTTATLSYNNGTYSFSSPENSFTSSKYLRLVASDPNYYFTISNYDRRVLYRAKQNFNSYRDTLELKYSPRKNIPYVVNELLLDTYIAGIAETTNNVAAEYAKAVLTAARSYAYYHINNGVPASQRTFDLYASTIDQLYLGYNSELLMPNIVKYAKATYGEMVTYKNQVIITPYFGHSDGSTRTWSEVWGGTNKPWLQRVETTYDKGLSMYGHGVGMSTHDASFRASKDGWNYKKILKYYYTGVEVEKIY